MVVVNKVDTSVPGTYKVTYNVSDKAGNTAAEVTRTVDVVETKLTIELILSSNTFDAGSIFKYKLKLSNIGTTDATDVTLQTHIPENIIYISNKLNGDFNKDTNNVTWNFSKFVQAIV